MSNLQPLDRAVLRTLAYFDVFDYPLTVEEVWRWLWPDPTKPVGSVTLDDVNQALASPEVHSHISLTGDMVTLFGREQIVTLRQERQAENSKKWKRALTVARYVELVPFVRMVAVVNTLAINNARPISDIDLLVVTAPHNIWIARWLVTGVVWLLGYRRRGTTVTNRVCLSFFVTTDAVDLGLLQREQPDTHFAFWTSQAVPLLDVNDTYEKFRQANTWVTKLIPHGFDWNWKQRLLVPNPSLKAVQQFFETFFSAPIGRWGANWIRQYQLKRLSKTTNSRASEPTTDVIVSEDVLKFHEADRRGQYNQAVAERLKKLGL